MRPGAPIWLLGAETACCCRHMQVPIRLLARAARQAAARGHARSRACCLAQRADGRPAVRRAPPCASTRFHCDSTRFHVPPRAPTRTLALSGTPSSCSSSSRRTRSSRRATTWAISRAKSRRSTARRRASTPRSPATSTAADTARGAWRRRLSVRGRGLELAHEPTRARRSLSLSHTHTHMLHTRLSKPPHALSLSTWLGASR